MALSVKRSNAFQLGVRSFSSQQKPAVACPPWFPSIQGSSFSSNSMSSRMDQSQEVSNVISDFHWLHLLLEMKSSCKLFFSYAMLEQFENEEYSICKESFKQKVQKVMQRFSPVRNQICGTIYTNENDLDTASSNGFENLLHQYHNIGSYESRFCYFIWDDEEIQFNDDELCPVFKKYGFRNLKEEIESKIKLLSISFNDEDSYRFCSTEKKIKFIQEVRSCPDNLWFNDDLHLGEEKNEVRLDEILYELQHGKCFICGEPIPIESDFLSKKEYMMESFLYDKNVKTAIWNYYLCHNNCSKERNGEVLPVKRFLEPWVKLNISLANYLEEFYFKNTGIEKAFNQSREDAIRAFLTIRFTDYCNDIS